METFLSICVGVGLSAACGFRVFVPMLFLSIASLSGHVTLAQGFQWIGSYPALIAFSVATVLEITAYYVPWLDNLLDTISTPAAVIAGTIVTASVITDMSPFLRWTLAVIAGGSAAGLVQCTTVAARGVSTTLTGGLANPVVATGELAGSFIASATALVAPVLAVLLAITAVGLVAAKLSPKFKRPGAIAPPVMN